MGKLHEESEKILKVPSLEELYIELKKHNRILDGNIIRYLQKLIDLEFSALRKDVLNDEERKTLSEISLYRKITTYNIYQRSLDLLESQKEYFDLNLIDNNCGYEGLIVSGTTPEEDTFSIFDYHYAIEHPYISLYEYEENQVQREKEMASILDQLEILYDDKKAYFGKISTFTGLDFKTKAYRKRKISELEKQFSELDKRNKMPAEERYKAEVKNYFAELFEKEYGIRPKKNYIDDSKITFPVENKSYIVKELRCEYPTLTLKKEVKYY